MVYQGSKNRLAKYLVPIIENLIKENNITTYIEPMVGGANLIDKVHCENKIGIDINDKLIKLLKKIQQEPDISWAPEEVPFEFYSEVRTNQNTGKYSDELVALVGWGGHPMVVDTLMVDMEELPKKGEAFMEND